MEWTVVHTVVALIAIFVTAVAGVCQLNTLQKRHRFDTAPFVTFDIEETTGTMPPEQEAVDYILKVSEFDDWANAHPTALNRYVILRLTNKQHHIAGAATSVSFRIAFTFSKHGTPDSSVTIPYPVEGKIWLKPEESYRIVIANLKGLQAATIDVDNIEYSDIDRNKYKRFYGYCHWELDNTETEWWGFKTSK